MATVSLRLVEHGIGPLPDERAFMNASSQFEFGRAIDAVIWGMPIVSFDAMRQAFFRDAKADYNDVIWWPKGSGWRNQSLTANTTVRYLYIFINTQQSGPVVVELPAANESGSFYGTFENAWQVPILDIGLGGSGGKYLVVPPDYTETVPSGYTVVRPETYNTLLPPRSIVNSNSDADIAAADALVKQIKIYPLSAAGSPSPQRFIDMTDTLYSGLIKYDSTFYASLARMVNEEPARLGDLQMLGMLMPLGVAKGIEFKPSADDATALDSAAAAAQKWLVAQLPTFVTPVWPKSHWNVPAAPIAMKSAFTWSTPEYFDVDSRGIAFSTFFAPPAKLGSDSFYLGTYADNTGGPLTGEHTYQLHVPPNVPASKFWSVTVYSLETSSFFPNSERLTVDSLEQGLVKNADGSVDVYFGPTPPVGKESNWLLTPTGERWTPWFRFYGPQKALFDKTWTMPDIHLVN
jgi:hypothetical protein